MWLSDQVVYLLSVMAGIGEATAADAISTDP